MKFDSTLDIIISSEGIEKCLIPLFLSEVEFLLQSYVGVTVPSDIRRQVQRRVDSIAHAYVARVPHYEDLYVFLRYSFLDRLEVVI